MLLFAAFPTCSYHFFSGGYYPPLRNEKAGSFHRTAERFRSALARFSITFVRWLFGKVPRQFCVTSSSAVICCFLIPGHFLLNQCSFRNSAQPDGKRRSLCPPSVGADIIRPISSARRDMLLFSAFPTCSYHIFSGGYYPPLRNEKAGSFHRTAERFRSALARFSITFVRRLFGKVPRAILRHFVVSRNILLFDSRPFSFGLMQFQAFCAAGRKTAFGVPSIRRGGYHPPDIIRPP